MAQTIAVLDFGSQLTQVIARRIRECQVNSKIYHFSTPAAKLREEGKTITPNTPVPANNGGNPKPPKSTSTSTTETTGTNETTTTSEPGNQATGPVQDLNNSGPFSLPLPLLILGALAILLVAAGAAGFFVKRHQNRPPPPSV